MVLGVMYVLLAAPVAVPPALLWRRDATRRLLWTGSALVLVTVSVPDYMLVGMNYEDFNKDFPLWWVIGITCAIVEIPVLACAFGWQVLTCLVQRANTRGPRRH